MKINKKNIVRISLLSSFFLFLAGCNAFEGACKDGINVSRWCQDKLDNGFEGNNESEYETTQARYDPSR